MRKNDNKAMFYPPPFDHELLFRFSLDHWWRYRPINEVNNCFELDNQVVWIIIGLTIQFGCVFDFVYKLLW